MSDAAPPVPPEMTAFYHPRPRFAPVAGTLGFALLVALSLPAKVESQTSSGGRNVTVAYTPGSRSQNGYVDAQQRVTYFIRECVSDVSFLARYEPTVQMLVAPHRYWVDGREVRVPSQFAAPAAPKPTLRGVIRGQNLSRSIEYIFASTNPSCWTNGQPLGPRAGFWSQDATESQKLAVLNAIGFDQQGSLPALRNSEVEAHFRTIFAAERADSAARVATARADSLARAQAARTAENLATARRDSISRAEAARRRAAAAASATAQNASASAAGSTGAASGVASGAAAGSSTSGAANSGTSTQRSADAATQRAAEERQRQEAAEQRQRLAAAEQRAADAEHARVTAAHQREMAIQDSIRINEAAQATAQVALLLGAGIGRVLDGLDGTGLAFGASWNAPYFPGDGGRVGITTTGHIEGFMAPFLEMSFPVGGKDLGSEYAKGMSFTVGSVIPNTTFRNFLGTWQPHIGMTFLSTSETVHEFNSTLRTRSLLMFGLTRKSDHILRIDATIYGGSPRFGLSYAKAL